MENSRSEQFLSVKLGAVLRSVMKTATASLTSAASLTPLFSVGETAEEWHSLETKHGSNQAWPELVEDLASRSLSLIVRT